MKIFASASNLINDNIIADIGEMYYNMMSYYSIRKLNVDRIYNNTREVMIDSGAHSFQKGAKVEWESYTYEYANWIKKTDRPNIIAYFEMDVDNIIGYDEVLRLRKILTAVSDKIVPVWHKNRGIKDFKEMCKEYSGRIVSITGFKNEDISDDQYNMFLNEAWKNNCRLHCLGMTRKNILDKIPFDYTDSSSWMQFLRYASDINGMKLSWPLTKEKRELATKYSYQLLMKKQKHYENKWERFDAVRRHSPALKK